MIKMIHFRQLLQHSWYESIGFPFLWSIPAMPRGDSDAWATQVLHTICPGLHPGDDTPALPHGVDTTWEAAITSYKPYCLTGVEQGTSVCFRQWERSSDLTGQLPPASSWAAPSQIGAVLPQFICLTGCLRLMDNTRQANCNHCTK